MSKKIIPIVTLLGASALIVGATIKPSEEKKENFIHHINSFENEVAKYTSVNDTNLTTKVLNKYTLSIQENLDDLNNQELSEVSENPLESSGNSSLNTENLNELTTETEIDNEINNQDEINTEIEQISTLYSISNDIEDSCGEFCKLKDNIAQAIVETQNLIQKVQKKELELTNEQRLFISEQAQQLKSLGRQLSNITTELSFNLSDLNQIMTLSDNNLDNLSLKYLVVLDNLVNGNEMLQSGLNSLNLINQMFNMQTNAIPPNNTGRVLYGFRHNDNPPVIKDYYFDENGDLIENTQENDIEESENSKLKEENPNLKEKKLNIDTYKNNNLNTNLDTYNNNNLPHNIDSFFNTALLDNEFMYGNGNYGNLGYGYGGMNGINNNSYNQNYLNYQNNSSSNSVNNNENTQDIVNRVNQDETTNKSQKEKKRFKLKKNIDTFKDENEPDIKTKLGNIKNSISGFFNKFKISGLEDKIDNPVYRYSPSEKE